MRTINPTREVIDWSLLLPGLHALREELRFRRKALQVIRNEIGRAVYLASLEQVKKAFDEFAPSANDENRPHECTLTDPTGAQLRVEGRTRAECEREVADMERSYPLWSRRNGCKCSPVRPKKSCACGGGRSCCCHV